MCTCSKLMHVKSVVSYPTTFASFGASNESAPRRPNAKPLAYNKQDVCPDTSVQLVHGAIAIKQQQDARRQLVVALCEQVSLALDVLSVEPNTHRQAYAAASHAGGCHMSPLAHVLQTTQN